MAANPGAGFPTGLNLMQVVHEEVRSLPQITIGKLTGLVRGGGNEFLMALDMRFARDRQSRPVTARGTAGHHGRRWRHPVHDIAHRAGPSPGTASRPQLADAELAERYGLVNRALPADEIDAFVDSLARRIGALRPEIIAAVKTSVNAAATPITREGLAVENEMLTPLFSADAAALAHKLLAAGMQTREGERNLEALLAQF